MSNKNRYGDSTEDMICFIAIVSINTLSNFIYYFELRCDLKKYILSYTLNI